MSYEAQYVEAKAKAKKAYSDEVRSLDRMKDSLIKELFKEQFAGGAEMFAAGFIKGYLLSQEETLASEIVSPE